MDPQKGYAEELTDRTQTRVNLSTEGAEVGNDQVVISFFSTPSATRSPVSRQVLMRPKKSRGRNQVIEEPERLLAACEWRHTVDVQKLTLAIRNQKLLNSSGITSLCLRSYPCLKAAHTLALRAYFYQWKSVEVNREKAANSQFVIRYDTGINILKFLVRNVLQRTFIQMYERGDTLSLVKTYEEMQESDWKKRELESRTVVKKKTFETRRPKPLSYV